MAENNETKKNQRSGFEVRGKLGTEDLNAAVTINDNMTEFIREVASTSNTVNLTGSNTVTLDRSATKPTEDQPLWSAIRNRTDAIGFNRYSDFIKNVLCENSDSPGTSDINSQDGLPDHDSFSLNDRPDHGSPSIVDKKLSLINRPTIYGSDSYKLLKLATEAFLIFETGVLLENNEENDSDNFLFNQEEKRRLGYSVTDNGNPVTIDTIRTDLQSYLGIGDGQLPYLDRILTQIVGNEEGRREERLPYCESILRHRVSCPAFIELIWSYWHEEAMLVQTMNLISMRFQNKRSRSDDPLANLALDPLRPLNNMVWGYMQDEFSRLSIKRRAYEYDHHYGFNLEGKAISGLNPADSRTKFIEAFHGLLHGISMFYREDDDATIVADAFKLLNALREVHLILSDGAQNQYGDLPWTARKEMLMAQWMLARPEMKEFLRGRYMTPYQEPWMGAVDDMKRLQGWSDVTVTHFHELAIYGEQILLSIRFGDWIDINDQEQARNWARYWRPEIQRYIHAYNAVSGVDLSVEISDIRMANDRFLQPSVLLSKRLKAGYGQKHLSKRASTRVPNGKIAKNSPAGYLTGKHEL
ncbi:MAG: hypothetical protein V3U87_05280 [Methylococcaceae bacterium]